MRGKAVSEILLTLLLIGLLFATFSIHPAKAPPATIIVPDDYEKIQWAIGNASDGDTIFVRAGIYYEQVVVNKSVSLVGEDDVAKTAIFTNGTNFTVYISANNVTINGFEIQNSMLGEWGVILNRSSNSILTGNVVKAVYAILVEGGSGNNISDNRVVGLLDSCVIDGLKLVNSSNNVVTDNYLSYDCHNTFTMYNSDHNYIAFNSISGHFSPFPFTINKSNNNSIIGNTIRTPGLFGGHIQFRGSNGNVLYHNGFIVDEGSITMSIDNASMNNIWDDDYPSGGNYWSDYVGVDVKNGSNQDHPSSDGIGDTSYIVDTNNTDRYPLMYPWGSTPPPSHSLTIYSSPTGVTFTIDNVSRTTPWSGTYSENASTNLVMPKKRNGHLWSHWLEDGDTNRTKTIIMNTNITLTGVFTFVPPGATVNIDPNTLNLKSKGRWITCYIELPEGYDVNDINRTTILLNGTIPVDSFWLDKPLESVVGDHDNDTIPDLMVKFSRAAVIDYILNQNVTNKTVTLTVTGELYDGTLFENNDVIGVKTPSNAMVRMPTEVNSDNEKTLVMTEFPSLIVLPLFIITTLLAVVYLKKRKKA